MDAPRPRSRDLGAALAGLVLGGSVMFLIILTIVWLTNSHFAAEKAEKASPRPAAEAPAAGAIPSTAGSPGPAAAPVAPSPTDAPPGAKK